MTDWITTPIDARILRGALEVERTARGVLPHRLRRRPRWSGREAVRRIRSICWP